MIVHTFIFMFSLKQKIDFIYILFLKLKHMKQSIELRITVAGINLKNQQLEFK